MMEFWSDATFFFRALKFDGQAMLHTAFSTGEKRHGPTHFDHRKGSGFGCTGPDDSVRLYGILQLAGARPARSAVLQLAGNGRGKT